MPEQRSRAWAALVTGVSAGRTRPDQIRGGNHGLTPEQVADSQQGRVLAALREEMAQRHLEEVPVADVIARAGVSRKTFYEHYKSKEECFAALYQRELDGLLAPTLRAFEGTEPWVERLRAALGVLLGALAADPVAARICFVEVLAAGPVALARRNQAMGKLGVVFAHGGGGGSSSALAAGAIGYLAEVLNREIAAGRIDRLPELRGELVKALAPSIAEPAAEPSAEAASEHGFLRRYGPAAAELLGRVADAMARVAAPAERVRSGARALLDFCAEHPEAARVCIVEALSAGPRARARRTETTTRLAGLFEDPLRDLRPSARIAHVSALALVGGFYELAFDAVDRRAVGDLPSVDEVVAVARLEPGPSA